MLVRDEKIRRKRHPFPYDDKEHPVCNRDDGTHQKKETAVEKQKESNVSFVEIRANVAERIKRDRESDQRNDQKEERRKGVNAKCHLPERSRREQRHDGIFP